MYVHQPCIHWYVCLMQAWRSKCNSDKISCSTRKHTLDCGAIYVSNRLDDGFGWCTAMGPFACFHFVYVSSSFSLKWSHDNICYRVYSKSSSLSMTFSLMKLVKHFWKSTFVCMCMCERVWSRKSAKEAARNHRQNGSSRTSVLYVCLVIDTQSQQDNLWQHLKTLKLYQSFASSFIYDMHRIT